MKQQAAGVMAAGVIAQRWASSMAFNIPKIGSAQTHLLLDILGQLVDLLLVVGTLCLPAGMPLEPA